MYCQWSFQLKLQYYYSDVGVLLGPGEDSAFGFVVGEYGRPVTP
jgi:hypothetical protein